MAWLPVVIFFISIIVLAFIPIEVTWNPPNLLKFLNITFLTIITFIVSILAARSYLGNHSGFFLLFGCGMLALGLGGALAALPLGRPGPNWTVTIYNLSAFLAGLCLMISAIEGWSVKQQKLRSGWPVLLTLYLGIILIESLLALALRNDLLPVFFVDGQGATIYDLVALWSTAGLFTSSAIILRFSYGSGKSVFYDWCTLGFWLIAIGLVGVSLQKNFGSPLNWASRLSQYLGGVYLLIAAISSVRQSGSWMLPLESALRESEARYRSLVESSPDGVIVHRNGKFLYANSAALRMYGADRLEQLQTKTVLDLISPDDRAAIEARMQQALVEKRIPLRETLMMSLDGRFTRVETVGSRVDYLGEPAVQIIIRDVTERKQAEKEIRLANERLKLAQLAAKVGTWDWDVLSGKLGWSSEMFALFGLDMQNATASFDTWKAVVHPEDLENASARIERALKDHSFLNNEYRIIRPDGEILWINALGKGLYDDQGRPVRMNGICIDITERKLAEEELRESEERLRFALETINAGAWDLDLVDHSAFRSIGHDLIFGYAQLLPEWSYEMFLDHVLPEDRSMVAGKYQWAMDNQSDWNFECRIRRTDGEVRWIWAAGRHTQKAAGAKRRMAGIVMDITERKLAEEELERHREHLEELVRERTSDLEAASLYSRSLIEASLDPLITISTEGKVMDVNKATEEVTGVPREHLIGTEFSHYVTDPVKAQEGYEKVLLEGFIKDYPLAIRHVSGRITEVIYNVAPYRNEDGEVLGFFAAARDFSKLRQAQQALQESHNELEEKNRLLIEEINQRRQAEEEKKSLVAQLIHVQKMDALGRFAGGIAHDLNNFLYPILVNTQMLLEESSPDSPFREVLEQSLTAIYRQRDLIKQILSFSRGGNQKFNPVHVKPLIHEALAMLKSIIPSTVTIKQIMNGPLDMVLGDPTQIQQIIMNLCTNAVDALDSRKGDIEIRIENAYLDANKDDPEIKAGAYLCLVVKDSGIGMTEEVMEHIFEPFFTTKESGKGTGMGLAVIHGIIRSHGGRITVESEPGKGAQFNVLLPLASGGYLADKLEASPAKGNETILLIDDEETILKSVGRLLKGFGYNVVAVNNGLEAIEVFSRIPESIDLVITDMTMPGMTGVELADKLLGIRSDIPIILCTGFNYAMNLQKAKDFGIKALLEKPADMNELKAAIDLALDHEGQKAGENQA